MDNVQSILSPEQLWMVSLSGILTRQNNDSIWDLSFSDKSNQERKASWLTMLKRDWGISNPKELEDTLSFLDNGGHNEDYLRFAAQWGHIPGEQCADMLSNIEDENYKSRALLANKHQAALAKSGIYGWDAGRYAHIVRTAYFTDMISEDEAWEKLLYIAHKTQPKFSSWQHFGLSYVVGRAYWAVDVLSKPFCDRMFSSYNEILLEEGHPWNQLEWNLPLPEPVEE